VLTVVDFFGNGIPAMSSFCHLPVVIISSKYILHSVGERGQPWYTPLLISASLDIFELHFINI
jgi:hypothetical protein